ncbi:MAG: LysR substrate-binding domain-containing protein [Hyphomicrobiales bacterium]|nr:LysR substrate-binding domain-containing protein [Hyphomicrobiales bacterium]
MMIDPQLREKFLGGMSHAACTVNIVTTDGPAGRAGVTVSAMASVSAETPRPTLLVCVHHESLAASKMHDNGVFCVNVLRDDQAYISDTFAGRFKETLQDKFECADWLPMPSGSPRVVDPLVGFDCTIASSNRIGAHYVFFGEVNDIFIAERGSPLIYANRAYGATSRIETAASIGTAKNASKNTLSVGCFHTFSPYILPEIIERMHMRSPEVLIELVEGDQRRVQESLQAGETELALLYDIDLHGELDKTPLTELEPYVLLAEGHPLAQKNTLTPKDLAEYPMVLLDAPPSRDYFTGILESAGVRPNISLRSSSLEMVRGMVAHGLGYSLLATKPASSMSYDGRALVSRVLCADAKPSQVVLTKRKGLRLSQPAQQFHDFCYDFFHTNSQGENK